MTDSGKPAKPPEPAAPEPPPAAAAPPSRPAPPEPAPAAGNDQSDIDAMLADLEVPAEAPKVEPEPAEPAAAPPPADVLDLSEANVAPSPGPAPSFRTIDGDSDVVFADRVPEPPPHVVEEPEQSSMQAPAPDRTLISNATARCGGQRVQLARPHRARAERAHARGSGQGDVAADVEVLARRQSAEPGRAHRARRDRTGFARQAVAPNLDVAAAPEPDPEPQRQHRP